MRCAPTPPQCPLPSILIAVCVPMSSHCDFYGMCAQHLVAFVGGNYVIFFTKARCECLLPLPHGPPNPCQILPKMVPNRRGGTPWKGPERSKTAQGHPGALQETPRDGQKASPRASGSALEALWARLERHLGVQEVTLRGDFELKMKIDSGNADFLKSMLSPRREHRK